MLRTQNSLKIGVFTLLILVLTFPSFTLVSSPGLDSSYTWGLNHLFAKDYDRLSEVVYPIGILGFLKMPLPIANNLLLAYLFISILKTSTIYFLFSLIRSRNKVEHIASVVVVACVAACIGYDITFVALSSLLSLNYLKNKNFLFLIALSVLAYLGFAIKTSIGISCFSILFMTLLLNFLESKKWKKLWQGSLVSGVTVLLVGLLVFGSIHKVITHFFNAFAISSGYSSSLALHPMNNWWAIGGYLFLIGGFWFVFQQKSHRHLFVLLLPSFFMMWKHAMVREDSSHNGILLYFTFVFFGIAYLLSTHNKWKIALYGTVTVLLFWTNYRNISGYNGISFGFDGISNIVQLAQGNEHIHKQKKITRINLQPLILPTEVKTIIGNNTIDFYPWEHNYAQINELNWSPRKTIEIGASSSQWVSKLASEHYKGKEAPEFILWHFYPDKYEGNIGSFDGRLLLNDEPLVLENILTNYESVYLSPSFHLFRKKKKPNNFIEKAEEIKKALFGQWIDVPITKSFVRCKITLEPTSIDKLRTFFYKDDLYEIDYMLEDGRIFTYRFLPNTATDELWISPFFNEISTPTFSGKTKSFRLRKVFYPSQENGFSYQIIQNEIQSDSTTLAPFNKFQKQEVNELYSNYMDFETQSPDNWFERSELGFQSKSANLINKDKFSFTYKISLDSLWKKTQNEKIIIWIQAKTKYGGKIADLVVETKHTQNDFWIPVGVKNRKKWQHIFLQKTISKKDHLTGEILVYFWNKDKEPLLIDDFSVTIVSPKN